jgi:F420-dependent oxidoreductase-like protein
MSGGGSSLPQVRAGVFVAYWPWFSFEEQVSLAVAADRGGLDSVWVAEAWGQDAVSLCGYLAARTERIALGTALMQIPARPPAATAMAAATIDVMSGGRFRLGLGVSGPQVSEGWYGTPFKRPVSRTREYVEIVRQALAGDKLEYHGREYELPLPGGLGKPLRLLAKPVQERIPIYLGAIGPKAVAQVGEIADGWLPFLVDPEDPDTLFAPLREGLDKAGRSIGELDVAAAVPVGLSEDIGEARAAVKPLMAFYLGAMGAKEKNFYVELAERAGFGDQARAVQEKWLARDHAGALDAVPDELVDRMSICTTPAGLDDRMAAYERAGVDTLVCIPCGPDRPAIVDALAAATT